MKLYCPYSNIDGEKLANNEYPDLLVIGGMNDPRVAFFEPLRLIAKMRNERDKWIKTNDKDDTSRKDSLLLLQLDDSGHGGTSGQYSYLESLAFEYAFIISSLQAPMKSINNIDDVRIALVPRLEHRPDPKEKVSKGERKKSRPNNGVKEGKRVNRKGKLLQWINNMF